MEQQEEDIIDEETENSLPKTERKQILSGESSDIILKSESSSRKIAVATLKTVREKWGNHVDFLLSTISLTVGLGNIWRFPYICQAYGGGAFLISYTICCLTLGFPYLLLESAAGQYFQAGPLSLWEICPVLKGIGLHSLFITFWTSSYYIVILTWVSFYMFSSLTLENLPWQKCNNSWNTIKCIPVFGYSSNESVSTSVEEFWKFAVTNESDDMIKIGQPQWYLFILLALLWVCNYFCVFRGIKMLGKILSVISVITCMTILIILIRSFSLHGAMAGISYMFKPDFRKLLKSEVWYEASSQVFFSYTIGFGAILTYCSYNDFNTNIWRSSIAILICDYVISIMLAAMVYCVLGLSLIEEEHNGQFISEKRQELVFHAYPEAVILLPAAPIWSFSFFTGTLLLGFTSQLGLVQTLISAVEDEYKVCKQYRWLTTLILCFIEFGVGVLMITRAGVYYVYFLDKYVSNGWTIMSEVLLEGLGISYTFGADKMVNKISYMIGYRIPKCMKFWWWYISPSILGLLGDQPGYRWWIDVCGVLMILFSISLVPGYMVHRILKEEGSCKQRLKKSKKPKDSHYI